ncbi:MAG: hypothetical protein O4859_10040 [Trichodesmium sp. St18_bin1]|nr:hypothetical protein [Trichodesmium sp. St18_bin1]MDE5121077.1 hypothetical protein [Trichodesmium sp. St19_bin1]
MAIIIGPSKLMLELYLDAGDREDVNDTLENLGDKFAKSRIPAAISLGFLVINEGFLT